MDPNNLRKGYRNDIFAKYDRELSVNAQPVASSSSNVRERFITKTYLNLTYAVLAFAALEAFVFATVGVNAVVAFCVQHAKLVSLMLLAICLGGPAILSFSLGKNPSRPRQYFALGFYVVMYALMFMPLLAFAMIKTGDMSLIWQASGLTAALFVALSSAVFFTRKDFSFLRSALMFVGIAAIILVVAAMIFGFTLGTWFVIAMIAFACGFVLYDTSNIMLHYQEGDDVFAAISIFSSLLTLFYYILMLLVSRSSDS